MIVFNKTLKGVQIYNYSLCCKNIFHPFCTSDIICYEFSGINNSHKGLNEMMFMV
jgi:hypothetical protein